jgi:hypothetical protein
VRTRPATDQLINKVILPIDYNELDDKEMDYEQYSMINKPIINEIKFVPKQPPVKESQAMPIGKKHTVGPKVVPDLVKTNFEGETDLLKIFKAINHEPVGSFLYLSHTYPKNSVDYNFYNIK